MGSATSYSDCHRYCLFLLEVCITYPTRASLDANDGRRSRIGARDETTSSKSQVMIYPYYVETLKPIPPTTYHGQGLAWSSHTGSYKSAMSKTQEIAMNTHVSAIGLPVTQSTGARGVPHCPWRAGRRLLKIVLRHRPYGYRYRYSIQNPYRSIQDQYRSRGEGAVSNVSCQMATWP